MNEFLAKGKINLNLKVLSKRPDGYHNIESVMTELDFGDTSVSYTHLTLPTTPYV